MRYGASTRIGRRAWTVSALLHATGFVVAWVSTLGSAEPIDFVTYEVDLVSPPPAVNAEEVVEAAEELVVERPDPEPPPPEPEVEEVVPVEEPEPEPTEPEPDPTPPEPPVEDEPETAEEETVAAAPVEDPPDEEPEVSGEDLNVRIEGLRRDYPAYYDNIIRQILRCFRWRDGGRWETTIRFWITRDGTATGIDFEQRSGNSAFDFEAMGAVDCAGDGDFGPLPEDLPYDRFPVLFDFRPTGGDAHALPGLGLGSDDGPTKQR